MHNTTAVRFNSKGNLCASGDEMGNVIIWESWGTIPIRKKFDNVLNAPIRDIAWSPDDKRIVIVGEGKQNFGRIFIVDTQTTGGEISGANKNINSADVRPTRPFKMASGSDDQTIQFYEGANFKLSKIIKEHTGFVNCVRFSPDGKYLVAVSADKSIT